MILFAMQMFIKIVLNHIRINTDNCQTIIITIIYTKCIINISDVRNNRFVWNKGNLSWRKAQPFANLTCNQELRQVMSFNG